MRLGIKRLQNTKWDFMSLRKMLKGLGVQVHVLLCLPSWKLGPKRKETNGSSELLAAWLVPCSKSWVLSSQTLFRETRLADTGWGTLNQVGQECSGQQGG